MPNIKLLWLAVVFALVQSAGSHAADINLIRGAKGDEDTITITGSFKMWDDTKFQSVALATSRATVFLDSKGGQVQPAFEIGRIIRIKGFATAAQGTVCASACAMVWLAGEPRMMTNFTSIGFHAPYDADEKGRKRSDAKHGAMVGAYLTSLGFSQKVVMYVVTAGAEDMHWLKKSTADKLGIAVTFTTAAQKRKALEAFSAGLKARMSASVPKEEAALLYRQSADLGFAGAQNNLGDLYEAGQGVPKSEKAAIYWYTRAAERGEPTAYLSLASLLSAGTTDHEVLVEALKYALLAATALPDGKNKAAAEVLAMSLSAKFTDAQKTRVYDLVNQWAPLYQEERLMGDTPGSPP